MSSVRAGTPRKGNKYAHRKWPNTGESTSCLCSCTTQRKSEFVSGLIHWWKGLNAAAARTRVALRIPNNHPIALRDGKNIAGPCIKQVASTNTHDAPTEKSWLEFISNQIGASRAKYDRINPPVRPFWIRIAIKQSNVMRKDGSEVTSDSKSRRISVAYGIIGHVGI